LALFLRNLGQSRPGRASNKSGYARYAPKAEVNSEITGTATGHCGLMTPPHIRTALAARRAAEQPLSCSYNQPSEMARVDPDEEVLSSGRAPSRLIQLNADFRAFERVLVTKIMGAKLWANADHRKRKVPAAAVARRSPRAERPTRLQWRYWRNASLAARSIKRSLKTGVGCSPQQSSLRVLCLDPVPLPFLCFQVIEFGRQLLQGYAGPSRTFY
jgi:hypothetical protein